MASYSPNTPSLVEIPGERKNPIEWFRSLQPHQRNRLVLFGTGVIVLLVLGLLFWLPGNRVSQQQTIIEFWDVFDDYNAYGELINKYQSQNPGVTIRYAKKEFETYRNEVLNGLASGSGPDVYAIHNTWLPVEQSRLAAMNDAYQPQHVAEVIATYPDVVRFDFVREDPRSGVHNVYAIPLSIDTLGLYYHTGYFNSANILEAPATWDEFVADVKTLRRVNANGEVQVAGVAMGSAGNVNRATDILSLLMLQGGTRMNNPERDEVTFHFTASNSPAVPGLDALMFYTSFSDPSSENYTWDRNGIYSIDAFAEGRAAMMVNYSFQRATIRSKAPNLQFAIAPIPQPASQFERINYANYWGLGVAKASEHTDEAWKFINFLQQEENARVYLARTGRPAALRALANSQLGDEELGPFASQVLTAKSWVQGDARETEPIMQEMISATLVDRSRARAELVRAVNRINVIMDKLFNS